MLVWARPGGFLGGVRESAKGERESEGRKEVRREKGGPKGEGRSEGRREVLRDGVGRRDGISPIGVGVEVLDAVEGDAKALEDVACIYVYVISGYSQ